MRNPDLTIPACALAGTAGMLTWLIDDPQLQVQKKNKEEVVERRVLMLAKKKEKVPGGGIDIT